MLKFSHSIGNNDAGHQEAKQTEPYVIFTVDDEKFGVEAKKTLELVKYSKPLAMPHNFINAQGMSNFRGKLIPIVDLRLVFGLEPLAYGANTVIIVIDSGPTTFGIIAERVLDLLMVPVNLIKQIGNFNLGEKTRYLKSVANFGDQMILLLNLDKIIETKPASSASAMSEETPGSPSLIINKPAVVPDVLAQNNERKASSLENVSVEAHQAHSFELTAAEPKLSQAAEPPPVVVEERPKITEETMDQVWINDDSGMTKEDPPDYPITPQELEDFLNETAFNSGLKTEKPGAPEIDYETQNHSGDLLGSSEIERILAEIEQENEKEEEKLQVMGDEGPAEGFTEADMDDKPPIPVPEVHSDGILEPEQIDEIFLSLQTDTVLDLPEEPLQNDDEIAIDSGLTDQWLSNQVIDNILKELEIKAGAKTGDSAGDGEDQEIMIERIKAPEEKPDV
ncbi:MAG: purine-binding chemotaxis protein CheW [Firmicutes bacterium]|nr:purine-binding chemotaxis protein CheW [Bacillota bacterium]